MSAIYNYISLLFLHLMSGNELCCSGLSKVLHYEIILLYLLKNVLIYYNKLVSKHEI